jgi:hypothetical protein
MATNASGLWKLEEGRYKFFLEPQERTTPTILNSRLVKLMFDF